MRSKTSAALLLLLTLVLGGITGAVSHSLYQHHASAASSKPHRDIVAELTRSLSLDANQKTSLKTIMDESRERYRELDQQMKHQYEAERVQMRPQYDAVRHETRQQIRQILHEDQKAGFEQFLQDIDKQRRERESKPSQ